MITESSLSASNTIIKKLENYTLNIILMVNIFIFILFIIFTKELVKETFTESSVVYKELNLPQDRKINNIWYKIKDSNGLRMVKVEPLKWTVYTDGKKELLIYDKFDLRIFRLIFNA